MPSHAEPTSRPTPDDDYIFSEQIGHLLRRTYQRHVALFQQGISDQHLTSAQFAVLCALQAGGACSLGEIVSRTAIDQATTRGIIDRLKRRGLLVVSQDAQDKRKVLVTPTEAGRQLVTDVIPSARQITETTFGRLNPAERLALVFLLHKMLEDEDTVTQP